MHTDDEQCVMKTHMAIMRNGFDLPQPGKDLLTCIVHVDSYHLSYTN